ncbi:hypothetical protein V0M98_03250 [Pseudomonas silesiensis]|uniref:hypothetical protein n=1 Tax=Pseudomonas silesiensis TaxID=1853130 RepID=UPI0030D19A3F
MLAKGSRTPPGIWFYALSFTTFASKLAPTGGSQVYWRGFIRTVKRLKPVGASLLAKGSRTPPGIWFYALSFTTFASKLAPTGGSQVYWRGFIRTVKRLKPVGASLLAKGSRTPPGIWFYALSFTTFASKLAPTGGSQVYWRGFIRTVKRLKPVGASLLAKGSRTPPGIWFYALSFTTFASKLAPTGGSRVYLRGFIRTVKRLKPVGASLLAKGSRTPLGIWFYALSFTTFASKLAPTGGSRVYWRGFIRTVKRLKPVGASLLAKGSRTPPGIWFYALSFTTFASKLAPTGGSQVYWRGFIRTVKRLKPVGASLLAKGSRTPPGIWFYALSFTTFASKLAPTGGSQVYLRGFIRAVASATRGSSGQ